MTEEIKSITLGNLVVDYPYVNQVISGNNDSLHLTNTVLPNTYPSYLDNDKKISIFTDVNTRPQNIPRTFSIYIELKLLDIKTLFAMVARQFALNNDFDESTISKNNKKSLGHKFESEYYKIRDELVWITGITFFKSYLKFPKIEEDIYFELKIDLIESIRKEFL